MLGSSCCTFSNCYFLKFLFVTNLNAFARKDAARKMKSCYMADKGTFLFPAPLEWRCSALAERKREMRYGLHDGGALSLYILYTLYSLVWEKQTTSSERCIFDGHINTSSFARASILRCKFHHLLTMFFESFISSYLKDSPHSNSKIQSDDNFMHFKTKTVV